MGMERLCVLTVANRYRDVHIPSMGLGAEHGAAVFSIRYEQSSSFFSRERVRPALWCDVR